MSEHETEPKVQEDTVGKIEERPARKGRPRKFQVPSDLDPVEAKRYLNNLYMANHRNNVSKRLGLLKEQVEKCLQESKLKGTLIFLGAQKQSFGLSFKGGCVSEIDKSELRPPTTISKN